MGLAITFPLFGAGAAFWNRSVRVQVKQK